MDIVSQGFRPLLAGVGLIALLMLGACQQTPIQQVPRPEPPLPAENMAEHKPSLPAQAYKVVAQARQYIGTPYRNGGTTSKGMDCSGLVHTCFKGVNVQLPRASYQMAERGTPVQRSELRIGDLVFFRLSGAKRISHVGIVSDVLPKEVYFIHSSSSRGVVCESLDAPFYLKGFVTARRVLGVEL